MEQQMVFHILGIEETKDEALIQAAYRNLLKKTNPEDDPEGFKRLREAYEEALVLARQEALEMEEEEEGEIPQWLSRIGDLYEDIERRHRAEPWERLLSEPLCEALDTSEEARTAILVFLMDHIHLPHAIWKLIDKTFHVVEDYDLLKEKFPKNFLDYFKYYAEQEGFLPFRFFQVRDESKANGDGYIDHYLSIKKEIDQNQWEGCEQKLQDLEAFGIYHPYEDVERIKLLLHFEQKEEAAALSEELLKKYQEDQYIKVYAAYAFWHKKEKDRAFALWNEILKDRPAYYQAKMGVVRYLMEKGNNYDAKEKLMEVLEGDGRDEEALALLKEANNRLIVEFKEKLHRGEPDERLPGQEMELELCWCLFQNEEIDQAIERLSEFVPEPKEEYGYSNLFGRVLYRAGQYDKALPHLERWLEIIEETVDDGTEENQKRISRRGRAAYLLGGCYFELGDVEKAEERVREAVKLTDNDGEKLGCMQYLSHILFKSGQFERSVDLCDEILKLDENYYPAYLTRMEACYELKKGQSVVDDYHRAVAIFPGFYKPYLLAAKVFFQYGQYEDAKGVLAQARENQVIFSDSMKLYEVKILRNLAKSQEDRKRPMEILADLKEHMEKETDLEDKSELEFETALLYWDDDRLEEALDHLRNAIHQNPKRLQYAMVKGHICLDFKRYDEALNAYHKAEPAYGGLAAIHYNKGLCYEGKGLKKIAVECFLKTLEIEKTYRDACEKLADYYREEYTKQYKKEDFLKAITFMDRQIEETENCYYLVHRGLMYMNALELEPAVSDFLKALQYSPRDWAAHNNLGCCYKYMGQFEKAIECFKTAVECMGESKSILPYSNMADCYEAMGQYQEAINCYEEDLKLFPDRLQFYKEIGELYGYMGELTKARKAFERIKGEEDYYSCMGDLEQRKGNLLKAVWYYTGGVRNAPEKSKGESLFDLALLYMDLWPSLAPVCLKKAIRATADETCLFRYEKWLAIYYYTTKRFKLSRAHAENALRHFKKAEMGTEEDYVAYKPSAPLRLCNFGWLYICMGDKKKGEKYFEKMVRVSRCKACRHKECYEKYYFEGMYFEAEGRDQEALEAYQQSLLRNPHSMDVEWVLTKLKKRMGHSL